MWGELVIGKKNYKICKKNNKAITNSRKKQTSDKDYDICLFSDTAQRMQILNTDLTKLDI